MLDDATLELLRRVFFRLLVKSTEKALSQLFRRLVKNKSKNELLIHGLQLFFEVSLKEEDVSGMEDLPIFKRRLTHVRELLGVPE